MYKDLTGIELLYHYDRNEALDVVYNSSVQLTIGTFQSSDVCDWMQLSLYSKRCMRKSREKT